MLITDGNGILKEIEHGVSGGRGGEGRGGSPPPIKNSQPLE